MKTRDFHFELPEELIALHPAPQRESSRLLWVNRETKKISHHRFSDLPSLLKSGDRLVLNNSKVLPARLLGQTPSGSPIEIFLLNPLGPDTWSCLVKPGKKVKPELEVSLKDKSTCRVSREGDKFWVQFPKKESFFSFLDQVGTIPLPPYIRREANETDKDRYQTVYAKFSGSVAAPTAGLHFSESVLSVCREKGILTGEVTLHVGYGTFAPIQEENLLNHQMHFESFFVKPEAYREIETTRKTGGRVVAVGTTSLRTLESIEKVGLEGQTNLFITPGYHFRAVDCLITNFHLPESTLFVLVAAFLGLDLAHQAYKEAIREKYRFFSYGDAMLIT